MLLYNMFRVWIRRFTDITKLVGVWLIFSLQVTLIRVIGILLVRLDLLLYVCYLRGFFREILALILSLEVRVYYKLYLRDANPWKE